MRQPTILCPVDFSIPSRGALRYALAIAEHFGATVTLLAVNDPILAEAAEIEAGSAWLAERVQADLLQFLADGIPHVPAGVTVTCRVATGKPATEILQQARTESAELIIMSSRGNSGVRKLFFGATTERVLRETGVPVLVTPVHDDGPESLEQLRHRLRRVLVPLDSMASTSPQLDVARAIAEALDATLLLAHVIEPAWYPHAVRRRLPISDTERRYRAERFLADAAGPPRSDRKVELLTTFGDPAEEIAKIAGDRAVGLVVIGLHGSPKQGPRMGSVTYRVLCLTSTLVLALPPAASDATHLSALTAASATTP